MDLLETKITRMNKEKKLKTMERNKKKEFTMKRKILKGKLIIKLTKEMTLLSRIRKEIRCASLRRAYKILSRKIREQSNKDYMPILSHEC